ncbi:hypothetical protein QSV37_11135 [Acinetobacter sp. VNK23]|uniref:hypothetical protein n=1 Tax=Acinetobacter thutiue TaxID=2998078 RepID=UPI00257919D2|nr:hypothetical protein [Acinetobacter thutiue]MDM1020847.1 hypothetical protein [Acinetobacter thutiue]
MSSQQDFLRFTEWKHNFEYEDFVHFLSTFDIERADFLDWIKQHQAQYYYFRFYALLAQNYISQQNKLMELIIFFVQQKKFSESDFKFIQFVQQKYPELLDIEKFELTLIGYIQQNQEPEKFSKIKNLIESLIRDFQPKLLKLQDYLLQLASTEFYTQLKYDDPLDILLNRAWNENQDNGILDIILQHFKKNNHFRTYSNTLGLWIKKTDNLKTQEKIVEIAQQSIQNAFTQTQLYLSEYYQRHQKENKIQALEPYISFLKYDQQQFNSTPLLIKIIEHPQLHLALRFEAVLSYYLLLKKYHPLKTEITQQFLTVPFLERWSYQGLLYSYHLFDQTLDFFSLDEKLLALNYPHWIADVYQCLMQPNYPPEQYDKIIQSILESIAHLFDRVIDHYQPNRCIYDGQYFDLLRRILVTYTLNEQQRTDLYQILLQGLEKSILKLDNESYYYQEIVVVMHRLGFQIPTQYYQLLTPWIKLELQWLEHGFNLQEIWQQLKDADVIYPEATFNPDEEFGSQFCSAIHSIEYNRKDDWFDKFVMDVFECYFDQPVEWLDEDSSINPDTLTKEQLINFNQIDPNLEWKYFNKNTFKLHEQYYQFFIYSTMGEYWTENRSFLSIFNNILKYFHSNLSIYCLEADYWNRDYVYFSAHAEKFDQLNQILKLPCIKPEFFTPEAKSPEFLMVEAEYKRIISNGGFSSYIDQHFIEIPKPHSKVSDEARKWLLSMQDEMKKRAFNYLEYSDENFIKQVIYIHNLFVALAINMVYDPARMNNVKQQKPFLQAQHYRSVGLDQQQRLAFIDMIFNSNTMGYQLKLNG